MVPWEYGKLLVWDATCTDTYAPSYAASSTSEAGAVAAMAEIRKRAKYINLDPSLTSNQWRTSGGFGPDTFPILKELGRRISRVTEKTRSFPFLVQRLAVAVQMGNSACVMGTLGNNSNMRTFSIRLLNGRAYLFIYLFILFIIFIYIFNLFIIIFIIIIF